MRRVVSQLFLPVLAIAAVGCTVEVKVPLEVSEELARAEATVAYVRDRVVTDESGKVYIYDSVLFC